MAKKSSFDFKQFVVQKGERVGFFAAAALLVLFLVMGGLVASKAASSGTITANIDSKIKATEGKISSGGEKPPDIADIVGPGADPTLRSIKFTEYPTPYAFFNPASVDSAKRTSPRIFPPTEAQVDFVRGSIRAYDIIDDGAGGRLIAVLVTKQKTQNDPRVLNLLRDKNKNRKQPIQLRGPGVPGVPGAPGVPGVPGVPGGPPSGVPGGAPSGAPGGKFGGGPGFAGGPGGFNNTQPTQDTEIQYVKLDSKELDSAKLAETLIPKRMVVVNFAVPYKQQVEEYRRALRAQTALELSSDDLPLYHSYTIERQVWSPDRKNLLEDWTKLDVEGTLGELYARVIDFEPDEVPPKDLDPTLVPFWVRLLPDRVHRLLVPRPSLSRGQYAPVNLPAVVPALEALKKLGGNIGELKTNTQQRLDNTDPFNVNPSGQQPGGFPGGLPGGPTGDDGPGRRPGGGFKGRGFPGGPGSMLPPSSMPPPGAFPGGVPGGPGGAYGANQPQAVPEDIWLGRFIDINTQPDYAYRYRVQIKAYNPNLNHDPKELATPGLAKIDELKSDWYEVPGFVQVPPEEYLYAAAKDDRANKVTEKLPGPGNWDEVWLQVQRWYDFIRPAEFVRNEPFGEWLVTEIKAHRGEYVGESVQVTLPIWSMVQSQFLFRENAKRPQARGLLPGPRPKPQPVWTVDVTPTPPVLLVDFEGGEGTYPAPARRGGTATMRDSAEVELLLLTADGKLQVARSSQDLANADRTKREEDWKAWLQKVQQDTDAAKAAGTNLNPFGGGRPGGPGGPGGGGSRD